MAKLGGLARCCGMFIESRGSVAPTWTEALAFLTTSGSSSSSSCCSSLSPPPPPTPPAQPFHFTDLPTQDNNMRSKFKDEHPFGVWCPPVDVRSQLIQRFIPQTSARRRRSASGRSTRTGYPCVVRPVPLMLPTYQLHAAHAALYRSSARRQTRRISPRLTRRSTSYHQCVLRSRHGCGGRAESEWSRCRT